MSTSPATTLATRLKPFQAPDDRKAVLQVVSTVVPFIVLWYCMYRTLEISYLWTLLLAVPAAGFLLRIFILQHDLGHGGFFRSKRINDLVGRIFGVLTLTPFHYWRRLHVDHHCHFGNLDRQGAGYFKILTVDQYRELGPLQRILYRLRRSPFVVFALGGPYLFLLEQRVPHGIPRSWKRERRSVQATNLAILVVAAGLALQIGPLELVMIHLPLVCLSSAVILWLIHVQHLFEDAYWRRGEEWDFIRSALEGSSYFKLPWPLQWFTANVGLHHVHHLGPRIPNYNLQRCHNEVAELRRVEPVTLRHSLGMLRLALWDEERQRLVTVRELGGRPRHPRSLEAVGRDRGAGVGAEAAR